ncbi:MAG TPA: hypothetical protein VJM46_04775 [Candidatus Saccharimonadales bacterium]|nr:hypothetical protein [Candidatus Saccharimonadales bacterium]
MQFSNSLQEEGINRTMRLDESKTYEIVSTVPSNSRGMKPGDIVGVNLCETGGPTFRVSVRLTHVNANGTFEGTTLALQKGQGQCVGGSFTDPAPDLSTR